MSYLRFWAALATSTAIVTGCGGGDINISADNNSVITDNSTNTGGGGSSSPCARYTDPDTGAVAEGFFDGTNCTYGADFVGENNPLAQDLTIPFISGAHIFNDVLVVGQNVNSGPAPSDGPTLTIEAGVTLAFEGDNYLLVNRGSRIVADGTRAQPITITSVADINGQNASNPFAVSQWGGVVINGKGITNQCSDAERASDDCHVLSEGKPSNYGGNDNADDSGVLRYVVIKHPGFEAAPGDELNGISLNAVGSGTVIENIEVFSTFDDGIEFFGGAVDVTNAVLLGIQDDSVDFADGYVGTVSNVLVIHRTNDGNRCIEGDNIGSGDFDTTPVSMPTITNMTCITSGFDDGTHGDSEGPLFRRGARFNFLNSIVYDGYARGGDGGFDLGSGGNECLELNNDETIEAADVAGGQESTAGGLLVVCGEPTKMQDTAGDDATFANGDDLTAWLEDEATYTGNGENVVIADSTNANVDVLDGIYTATAFTDATGAAFTVTPTAEAATSGDPAAPYIGAVLADDDWTEGWTFGIEFFQIGSAPAGEIGYIPAP